MKTSTILIISAVAASFIALTAFNLTQKAFYNKGEWRDRFYGMEYVAIKNVSDIELMGSEKMEVTIEKGVKEGLYIGKTFKEHITWSKNGNKLKFEVSQDAKKGAPFRNESFVLVLNRIDQVKTSPYVSLKFQKSYPRAEVQITGFNQNALALDLGKSGAVNLKKVELDTLIAKIGNKEGSASLRIQKEARIQTANFTIPGESGLVLNNPNINKATYNVSDRATVMLNGNVLKVLK
jgi:hypothetical protein